MKVERFNEVAEASGRGATVLTGTGPPPGWAPALFRHEVDLLPTKHPAVTASAMITTVKFSGLSQDKLRDEYTANSPVVWITPESLISGSFVSHLSAALSWQDMQCKEGCAPSTAPTRPQLWRRSIHWEKTIPVKQHQQDVTDWTVLHSGYFRKMWKFSDELQNPASWHLVCWFLSGFNATEVQNKCDEHAQLNKTCCFRVPSNLVPAPGTCMSHVNGTSLDTCIVSIWSVLQTGYYSW